MSFQTQGRHRCIRLASSVVLSGLLALPLSARAQDADDGPFAGLSGTWTGDGRVIMTDGSQERIRCRATYSVPPAGQSLNQGLRCTSDSYAFDVKSYVVVDESGQLTGTWSEATRQVSGEVTGTLTPGHIQTSVEALGFSAELSIATQGLRQSVSLKPESMDVQEVTIAMRHV